VTQQPNSGLAEHIVEVSRTHTDTHARTHTHPVGLLWTSNRLVAEAATCTTNTRDEHSCLQRDSNPLF